MREEIVDSMKERADEVIKEAIRAGYRYLVMKTLGSIGFDAIDKSATYTFQCFGTNTAPAEDVNTKVFDLLCFSNPSKIYVGMIQAERINPDKK